MNLRGAATIALTDNLPKALRALFRGFPVFHRLGGVIVDLVDRDYDLSGPGQYKALLREAYSLIKEAASIRSDEDARAQ